MIEKLDASVVKRIAAGEVIHSPRNAVKELMENSLDAGATNISIVLNKGGLEMIKVTDNGHGIKLEDMPLLCERYATSKLKEYKDLSKLRTFGFRGEALASISQISTVTVVSKHKDSSLGYKAIYQNGTLESQPKVHASNCGSTFTVENLFNNIPTRKKALESGNEEYRRVLDCVKKYAVHNANASFTLKKESSVELVCIRAPSKLEKIGQVYGRDISLCLKSVQFEDYQWRFQVFFNNIDKVATQNKKYEFILFVNNRLVENVKLKKDIKEAYNSIGGGYKPYFVYISLNVDPSHIDINVHPTKSEVHLLNEEKIIEKIVNVVKESLESFINGRKKQKVPPAPLLEKETLNYYFKPISSQRRESMSSGSSTVSSVTTPPPSSPTPIPKSKLDHYFQKGHGVKSNNRVFNIETPRRPVEKEVQHEKKQHTLDATASLAEQSTSFVGRKKRKSVYLEKVKNKQPESNTTQATDDTSTIYEENPQKLDSVMTIRSEIVSSEDKRVSKLISDCRQIGIVDDVLHAATYKNRHYLLNYNVISEEYFYQITINNISKFGTLMLSTPLSIQDCLAIAIPEATKGELNEYSYSILAHNDLLKSYYNLGVCLSKDKETVHVICLPMIIQNYAPKLDRMPIFLLNLAKHINWDYEIACLDELAHELASLYCCCDKKQWDYVLPFIQHGEFKAPKLLCDHGYIVELDFPQIVMEK